MTLAQLSQAFDSLLLISSGIGLLMPTLIFS